MEHTLKYSSISRQSLIEGTVDCDHILRVYGKVYGSVYSKKLVLDHAIVYGDIFVEENLEIINSHIYGSITAKTVTFSGVCSGDIHASKLEFMDDKCFVYGNIFVDSWCVKPKTKLWLKGRLAVTGIVKEFPWDKAVVSHAPLTQEKTWINKTVDESVLQNPGLNDLKTPLNKGEPFEEKAASQDPALTEKKRYNFLSNLAIVLILVITALLLYLVSQGIL